MNCGSWCMSKTISQNELEVIQLLIQHGHCTIAQFEGLLGVTATAVRQRLNRLMASGLIDRQSESEGRGRPIHRYRLTEAGRKQSGNNLSDFAVALWEEVQTLADHKLRKAIVDGAACRLASTYRGKIQGDNVQARMASVAELFAERDIPVEFVRNKNGLPILKILACPYPDLPKQEQNVCEMERKLFTEIVGGGVELCRCQHEGENCCSEKHGVQAQNQPISQTVQQTNAANNQNGYSGGNGNSNGNGHLPSGLQTPNYSS